MNLASGRNTEAAMEAAGAVVHATAVLVTTW